MESIQDIEQMADSLYEKIDNIHAELYSLGGEEERFELFERLRELIRIKDAEGDEVAAAVAGVMPAIEIVDSRFDAWESVGASSLISDNACNGGWVCGKLVRDWRNLDLAAQTVQVWVNGALARQGSGAAVLGHPLNALTWLVNKVNSRGETVRAGQYMTTGVVSEVYMAAPGDEIEATFGPLGAVRVGFAV